MENENVQMDRIYDERVGHRIKSNEFRRSVVMILVLKVISVILQALALGLSDNEAIEKVSKQFGLDPDEVKRWL